MLCHIQFRICKFISSTILFRSFPWLFSHLSNSHICEFISPPIIIFKPSAFALLTTSLTRYIFNTFSSPLMPSQFIYTLPKSHSYLFSCFPIFTEQISSLSQLIVLHSRSRFIKKNTSRLSFHPISISSNPCVPVTYFNIFTSIQSSLIYRPDITVIFCIQSSNSICFSLVRIFLTFFHTTFTVDLSCLLSFPLSSPILISSLVFSLLFSLSSLDKSNN